MILVALDAIADAPRTLLARVAAHAGVPAPALTDLEDPLANLPGGAPGEYENLLRLEVNAAGPVSASASAPPHPNAVDAVARLARRDLIDGITTWRDAGAAARWLGAHGLGTLPAYRFAAATDGGHPAALLQHARERRVRLLIQDDPRVAHAAAEAGYPVLLLDLPYNRALAHPRVLRAHDWRGIVDLLLALPVDRRKDRRGF